MTASIREPIEELLASWAWFLDHGQIDELTQLFTPDARFLSGGRELHGRDAIEERYRQRTGTRSTRHVYSCLRLTPRGPDAASSVSVWTCYATNAEAPVDDVGVYLIADFYDEFVIDADGRWRISSREIVPVFRDPSRAPGAA